MRDRRLKVYERDAQDLNNKVNKKVNKMKWYLMHFSFIHEVCDWGIIWYKESYSTENLLFLDTEK